MTCSVYLMECDAPAGGLSVCKVGISNSPTSRLASIRTATPFRVDLLWSWLLPSRDVAATVERLFHKQNANCRMQGEWFCGNTLNFSCEVDYIILDHIVENMGMSLYEARRVFINSGKSEEFANDLIISQYGVEP